MKVRPFIFAVLLTLFMGSCSSKTVLPYFTDIRNVAEGSLPTMDYIPVIEPDDELFITVNSLSPEASVPFNVPFTNPALSEEISENKTSTINTKVQTYRVDSDGNILFPVLGQIHVAGLTVEQLRTQLTEKISADIDDPIVTVQLANFQVYVAGEVTRPAAIKVSRNRFTVLDALASAGDMTPYGERSDVLVIREENGERKYAHLDLNSSETLTSPYFYLKQNDYVYVSPNKVRQANAKYNQNNAFKLTVVSTIVSATSVIASLVIALAVK